MSSITSQLLVLHPITRLIVGGAQENTMLTASLLNKDRFRVEILSGSQTGSEGSLIPEVLSRNIPLSIIPELVRQVNPWLDKQALKKMSFKMQEGKYQLVHTHSSKAGILGRFAARRAGVPIILHTVHGWSFHDYMSPLNRWLYVGLERIAASFTDALIFVSQHDMDTGMNMNIGQKDRYHLIRSAISFDDFIPTRFNHDSIRNDLNIPTDAIVVGTVSRFSNQKNPLDWVRVASMISKEYPKVFFLMVGDGPLRQQVEILLAEEGILSKTILVGIRRDIPQLLSAMDIFLTTSLWEGLPRSILQAMRMGIPVISNRISGIEEIIHHEDNGFLTTPKDLAQMAIFCGYLVENPAQRQRMGEIGRSLVKREFDLNNMIQRIENLYESLFSATS